MTRTLTLAAAVLAAGLTATPLWAATAYVTDPGYNYTHVIPDTLQRGWLSSTTPAAAGQPAYRADLTVTFRVWGTALAESAPVLSANSMWGGYRMEFVDSGNTYEGSFFEPTDWSIPGLPISDNQSRYDDTFTFTGSMLIAEEDALSGSAVRFYYGQTIFISAGQPMDTLSSSSEVVGGGLTINAVPAPASLPLLAMGGWAC